MGVGGGGGLRFAETEDAKVGPWLPARFGRMYDMHPTGRFGIKLVPTEARLPALADTFESKLVRIIANHLQHKATDVINVAAGPKREGWFNAESIVALSAARGLKKFIIYGEQAYRTALKNTGWTAQSIRTPSKVPDVCGYEYVGSDIEDETGSDRWTVNFILESKVLYAHERNRTSQLEKLREQLICARQYAPLALGLLYLIDFKRTKSRSRKITAAPSRPFEEAVRREVSRVFGNNPYEWVRGPQVLRGMRLKYTSFHVFPSVGMFISLAALKLR